MRLTSSETRRPPVAEVLGPDVDRLATLHTNARTDGELLRVWLKSHQDGSAHTIRVYKRVGERFLGEVGHIKHELVTARFGSPDQRAYVQLPRLVNCNLAGRRANDRPSGG